MSSENTSTEQGNTQQQNQPSAAQQSPLSVRMLFSNYVHLFLHGFGTYGMEPKGGFRGGALCNPKNNSITFDLEPTVYQSEMTGPELVYFNKKMGKFFKVIEEVAIELGYINTRYPEYSDILIRHASYDIMIRGDGEIAYNLIEGMIERSEKAIDPDSPKYDATHTALRNRSEAKGKLSQAFGQKLLQEQQWLVKNMEILFGGIMPKAVLGNIMDRRAMNIYYHKQCVPYAMRDIRAFMEKEAADEVEAEENIFTPKTQIRRDLN